MVEGAGADGRLRTRAGTGHLVHVELPGYRGSGKDPSTCATADSVPQPGDLLQVQVIHAGRHSLRGVLAD